MGTIQGTLRHYSYNQTVKRIATPTKIIAHTHGAGTISKAGFISFNSSKISMNNSRVGRIQGNTTFNILATHSFYSC